VANGFSFIRLTEPTIRLAERLIDAIPCAEQVKFAMSGAEATLYALRLARAFTGRERILRFEYAYHGHHDYSVVEPGGRGSASAGVPRAIHDTVVSAPFNDLETTGRLIAENASELAAVIVEPVNRAVAPRPGFLAGLRDLTRRHGVLLIFDEMVTGFRLAWGSAQQRYNVVPDLACFGKVIAGGFPGSAVVGRADVMALFDAGAGERYVWLSGTLSGNPVSSTAGLATLEILAEPGAYDRLGYLHDYLRNGLAEIARGLDRPLQITGDGNVIGLAFTDGDVTDPRVIATSDLRALAQLDGELLKRGILANTAAKLYVSLAHDQDDLNRTLAAFDDALKALPEA
jgi:glutamate-1-semialdehyde 2,1-aminomutase